MILYSYVIMSNYIHMIVQSENGKSSDLVRDFKKFIVKSILEKIQNKPVINVLISKFSIRYNSY